MTILKNRKGRVFAFYAVAQIIATSEVKIIIFSIVRERRTAEGRQLTKNPMANPPEGLLLHGQVAFQKTSQI